MNAIEAGHLVKRFGTVTALNDVTITVREGEIFGFLGPNGAGKTTTMRLLTGVLTPDSGTARINGIDIHRHRACQNAWQLTLQSLQNKAV